MGISPGAQGLANSPDVELKKELYRSLAVRPSSKVSPKMAKWGTSTLMIFLSPKIEHDEHESNWMLMSTGASWKWPEGFGHVIRGIRDGSQIFFHILKPKGKKVTHALAVCSEVRGEGNWLILQHWLGRHGSPK